jgi:hypothetical protein
MRRWRDAGVAAGADRGGSVAKIIDRLEAIRADQRQRELLAVAAGRG